MASYVKYQDFVERLVLQFHDFDSHTFKIALSNTAPNVATHTVLTDVTEISAGNGYTAGGTATAMTVTETGGTVKIAGTDVTFTASGGNIGPFRYAILYNSTIAPGYLIAYWDYGVSITITSGNSFLVDLDPSAGIFTLA